jgi:Na+-transporting NADH:ubiquinone oxidoreductase subunit NqrA
MWEYLFITTTTDLGTATVFRPDGGTRIIPAQHIVVTLNQLGQQGWELVQRNVAQSGLITYIMKRPKPVEPTEPRPAA